MKTLMYTLMAGTLLSLPVSPAMADNYNPNATTRGSYMNETSNPTGRDGSIQRRDNGYDLRDRDRNYNRDRTDTRSRGSHDDSRTYDNTRQRSDMHEGSYNRDTRDQDRSSDMRNTRSTSSDRTTAGYQLSNSQMRQVQQNLRNEGYNPGTIDGIWGPNTQAAVQRFQRDEGLRATGQLNQETLDKLGVQVSGGGTGTRSTDRY